MRTVLTFYIIFSFLFLVTRTSLWCFSDLFPKSFRKWDVPFTVIVPIKDEEPKVLINCLKRLVESNGEKQILVGDDGSDMPVTEILKYYPEILEKITLIRSEKNIGKVEIQMKLLEFAKHNICVNLDSDVLLKDKNTLLKLIAPFRNPKVGIANGQGRAIENGSLLHKIQGYQYLCAYSIARRSMGRFGICHCCSGEMLAFRWDYFKPFKDEYQKTKFLEKRITHGQDRFMTNIFLREGYKSINVPDAVSYSYPQKTYKRLLKQQFRWKKSSLRESIRCFSYMKNKNTYLRFWSLLHLVLPITFVLLFFSIIIKDIILLQFLHLFFLFAIVITFSAFAELPLLVENPKLIPMVVPFVLFNLLLIMPMWIIALFKLDDNSWLTR